MDLDELIQQLKDREPIFHRPELGTSREYFEAMIVDDYWEVGASGAVYEKELVINTLVGRYMDPEYVKKDTWHISDFSCRQLSGNTYLLTYVLDHKDRKTRRSTIWKNENNQWKAVYHQGTIVTA